MAQPLIGLAIAAGEPPESALQLARSARTRFGLCGLRHLGECPHALAGPRTREDTIVNRWAGCLLLYAALTGGSSASSDRPCPIMPSDSLSTPREPACSSSASHNMPIQLAGAQRPARCLSESGKCSWIEAWHRPPSGTRTSVPGGGAALPSRRLIVRFGEKLTRGKRNRRYPRRDLYRGPLAIPPTALDISCPLTNPQAHHQSGRFQGQSPTVTALLARVAAFHAAHVLLILDACFSGLALESMPRERFPIRRGHRAQERACCK